MAAATVSATFAASAAVYGDCPDAKHAWAVHDWNRPKPHRVSVSPSGVPSDAIVLFDGTKESFSKNWRYQRKNADPWRIADGAMTVLPAKKGSGVMTRREFGDCQLHLEFASPAEVKGEGQGRGNSGVFFMRKFEIQVLDCYENPTYPDGTVGGIYGQFPPLANAIRKPGEWNMYDFVFIASRFAGHQLITPAYITVFLNGVLLHHMKAIQGPTQHRRLAEYTLMNSVGALELQDHGDLVRFRNIWYRPLNNYDQA